MYTQVAASMHAMFAFEILRTYALGLPLARQVLMGCPFGPAIDTWSAGVMLLELLLGRPLFHTASSRAALLRQTLCAFGPLPLRRFRVGRYYSEYFAQDQSLKVMPSRSPQLRERALEMICACRARVFILSVSIRSLTRMVCTKLL